MDERELTTGSGSDGTGHKTRRPHRKSRYGCAKCKARRIKCDELTPRCSRCERMNLVCQYRKKMDTDGERVLPNWAWLAQTLEPAEVELFTHYLEHTSRDPSVDSQDQYALQVGIPKLACQSDPLMRSVLALAAVCKCCDIINRDPPSHNDADRGQVIELLSLAHQYYLDSLQGIQTTLHEAKHYDRVLANAAMMGMYGSASHWARIWLAKTATSNEPNQALRDLTAPGYPQWISLFRAVRLAYAGLLNNVSHPSPASPPSAAYSMERELKLPPAVLVAQPNPPTGTKDHHALGPILAATLRPALTKLYEKAAFAQENSNGTNPSLQPCLTALAIFTDIATTSLLPQSNMDDMNNIKNIKLPKPTPTHPLLPTVPPWLHHYTANITSVNPSRLPRRTIMSFVHKVPTAYLDLVENMMRLIQVRVQCQGQSRTTASSGRTPASSSPESPESGDGDDEMRGLPPSLAHQLALEVFAHWLVLVLLLDGEWWIGGVGGWELGRVVQVRRLDLGGGCLWGWEGYWWPEGMCEVAGVLERFKR